MKHLLTLLLAGIASSALAQEVSNVLPETSGAKSFTISADEQRMIIVRPLPRAIISTN